MNSRHKAKTKPVWSSLLLGLWVRVLAAERQYQWAACHTCCETESVFRSSNSCGIWGRC